MIFVNDAPHPVGTAAHDAVLGRLVTSFQQRGYQPEVRRGFGCAADALRAGRQRRGRAPGDTRTETLLVTAHYDSSRRPRRIRRRRGVAVILEVARAVRHERFRNTIRFLITDGEEAGLLGAEAIARDPQFLRGVAAVINIENRGTSGSSFLFETSPHNRSIIPVVARAMPRPSTSSLFYEVYRLLLTTRT
ncbi:MAG: Peptidase family M28 [Candidatus Udaeobacter sp.]|nr:MAG: Peptidase family M28 [Candidatus Udaeobacter sp.]